LRTSDLAQRPPAGKRGLRGARDLGERVGRSEALLGREPLHLLAELQAQLVVVACDQGRAVAGVIGGRDRMDGTPHTVRDDELPAVDGLVVALPRHPLHPRREREQRGVAGEVRSGAGGRRGEAAGRALGQPRAGQPEGEDLLCLHDDEANDRRRIAGLRAQVTRLTEPPSRRSRSGRRRPGPVGSATR
jgi:hypothetical protein